jgi:addiction module HigA family antidote
MSNRIPTHPGALLREDVFPALGKPVTAIAASLGVSRQTLHKILAEEAPVTPAMALRLGKFLGNGPDLWIGMQMRHDVALAKRELAASLKKIPTVAET